MNNMTIAKLVGMMTAGGNKVKVIRSLDNKELYCGSDSGLYQHYDISSAQFASFKVENDYLVIYAAIPIKTMTVKCIENKHCNTNFTEGKTYEASETGVRCDMGGMWTKFGDWNKPQSFEPGSTFDFAMCKFEILK